MDVSVKHRTRIELLQADRQKRRALFAEKRAVLLAKRAARLERLRTDRAKAVERAAEFVRPAADRPTST